MTISKLKPYLWKFVRVLVLIGFLALVYFTQDLKTLTGYLLSIDLESSLLFALVYFVTTFLRAYNVYLLTIPLKKLSYKDVFVYDLYGAASIFFLVPGGLGTIAFLLLYFRQENIPISSAIALTMLDKLISLLVCIIGTIFYFYIAATGYELFLNGQYLQYGALALIVGAVVSLLGWFKLRNNTELRSKLQQATDYARKVWPYAMANFCVTALIFAVNSYLFLICLNQLGYEIGPENHLSFVLSTFVQPIINLLPITFAGIGVGESASYFLWKNFSISSELTIAAFALVRGLSIFWLLILFLTTLAVYPKARTILSLVRKKKTAQTPTEALA